MFRLIALLGLAAWAPVSAADGPISVTIQPGKLVQKGSVIDFVTAGKPGPGTKGYVPEVAVGNFALGVRLPAGEPYDVWLTPKGGKPIRIAEKWQADPNRAEFDLSSKVGAVFVRGDDFPRADKIVLTPLKDPGPGYKGHIAVQVANDYKEDMLVPVGFYEVWLIPANGSPATKLSDNVRVQNGRTVEIPER